MQSTVYFGDATNANRKIFWISAFNNGSVPKTITVDTAPTGLTAGVSTGTIGGRMVWTVNNFEAALRAGDQVTVNNSPASSASAFFTARSSGDTTTGNYKIVGKSGTRPVFTDTSTTSIFTANTQTRIYVENLEFAQQGASGTVINANVANWTLVNIKVSDGGGTGINTGNAGTLFNSEVGGVGSAGLSFTGATACRTFGNYIHDNGGDGITDNTTTGRNSYAFNILDTNAGRGMFFSGATAGLTAMFFNNTVYANGNSGLEFTAFWDSMTYNNIFQNNGDAAGEYNFELVAGTAEGLGAHGYNDFNTAGGGGSGNVFGLTINSTEITTDPLFTNASGGDFSLQTGSPCIGTAYPGVFVGGSTGYLDMGAVQKLAVAGGVLAHFLTMMGCGA